MRTLKKQIKSIKQEVKKLEGEMEDLIKENDQQMLTNFSSIPGVGKRRPCF